MKIYVGASYHLHSEARAIASLLRSLGHEIASSWHDAPAHAEGSRPRDDAESAAHATTCEREIRACDRVVILLHPQLGAGCFYEAGFARALGIPVTWIGDRRSVFDAPREGVERW